MYFLEIIYVLIKNYKRIVPNSWYRVAKFSKKNKRIGSLFREIQVYVLEPLTPLHKFPRPPALWK